MNEAEERLWIQGRKAAYQSMLNECLHALGVDDPIAQAAAYLEERTATIAYLRSACADDGDNDWPDDLYIPDIIEKHLIDYWPETENECMGCGELPADCTCIFEKSA